MWWNNLSATELAAARDAHVAAIAAAKYYIDYSDFSVWVLRVHRVRWVGGYGRMDSATAADYAAAAPDPIRPQAAGAITHLNADHASGLADIARALGGYPDAECRGRAPVLIATALTSRSARPAVMPTPGPDSAGRSVR